MKKQKILIKILLVIIIVLIALVTLMFNQNSKLNKMSEIKEQLSTEDGIITTSEHLKQISATEEEAYERGKEDGQKEASATMSNIVNLGSGTSFDLTSYEGYENFTANNFIIMPGTVGRFNSGGNVTDTNGCEYMQAYATMTKTLSYNSSTGKLTAYYTVISEAVAHKTNFASGVSKNVSKNVSVTAYLVY